MSETKLEVKTVDHSETFRIFRYDSKILTLQKFRNVCEIFAMSNSEIFFDFFDFFINNNNKIIKIKTFF